MRRICLSAGTPNRVNRSLSRSTIRAETRAFVNADAAFSKGPSVNQSYAILFRSTRLSRVIRVPMISVN